MGVIGTVSLLASERDHVRHNFDNVASSALDTKRLINALEAISKQTRLSLFSIDAERSLQLLGWRYSPTHRVTEIDIKQRFYRYYVDSKIKCNAQHSSSSTQTRYIPSTSKSSAYSLQECTGNFMTILDVGFCLPEISSA
jgi:hypothetical protein